MLGVLSKKNLVFMREISFVVGCPDYSALLELVRGLPMAGWARHCPSLVQRFSIVPVAIDSSLDNVDVHNENVLKSVRSSGDEGADRLAWSKCLVEFATGGLLGPWKSIQDIPYKLFRLLQRFVIHEQHGGQEATVRCIDNCLIG